MHFCPTQLPLLYLEKLILLMAMLPERDKGRGFSVVKQEELNFPLLVYLPR